MEIINSFNKETIYEFSEAVPVFGDNIYFIFKVDIISIEANPSKSRIDKLKEFIKDERYDSFVEKNKNRLLEQFIEKCSL